MNIMYVSDLSGLGGGEVSLLYLMKELINKGHKVSLICRYDGKLVEEAQELGVKVYVFNFKKKLVSTYIRIRDIIKKDNIDIVHSNEITTSILMGAFGRRRVSNMCTCHGQWYQFSKVKKMLANKFIKHIFCVSRAVEDNLNKQGIGKTSVSYLGVPVEKFEVTDDCREQLREELKIKDGDIVVLTIARFQEIKGQLKGVQVVEKLLDKGFPIKYFLIGDSIFGSEKDDLYKLKVVEYINEHNLSDNIHLLGERHDIPDLLLASDLVLVTSDNESFGVVVAEALAAHKPVLSTPCDGVREILNDNSDMISKENTVESLVELVEIYLQSENVKEKVATHVELCRGKFLVGNVVKIFLGKYMD